MVLVVGGCSPQGRDRRVVSPAPLLPHLYLSPGLQVSELWEVVEEPRGRLGADRIMPERQEGHLLKKRKWPLKGWHKVGWAGQREGPRLQGQIGEAAWQGKVPGRRSRAHVCGHSLPHTSLGTLGTCFFLTTSQRYFVLEDGILHYATTRQDVSQDLIGGRGRGLAPKCPGLGVGFWQVSEQGPVLGTSFATSQVLSRPLLSSECDVA